MPSEDELQKLRAAYESAFGKIPTPEEAERVAVVLFGEPGPSEQPVAGLVRQTPLRPEVVTEILKRLEGPDAVTIIVFLLQKLITFDRGLDAHPATRGLQISPVWQEIVSAVNLLVPTDDAE